MLLAKQEPIATSKEASRSFPELLNGTTIVAVKCFSEKKSQPAEYDFQWWPGRILCKNEVVHEIQEGRAGPGGQSRILVNLLAFQGHHKLSWREPAHIGPYNKDLFVNSDEIGMKSAIAWADAMKEIETFGRSSMNTGDCLMCRACLDKPSNGGSCVLKKSCYMTKRFNQSESNEAHLSGMPLGPEEKEEQKVEDSKKPWKYWSKETDKQAGFEVEVHHLNVNAYRFTKDAVVCPWRCPGCLLTGFDVLLKCQCAQGFRTWFGSRCMLYSSMKCCPIAKQCFWCTKLGIGSAIAIGDWSLDQPSPLYAVAAKEKTNLKRKATVDFHDSLKVPRIESQIHRGNMPVWSTACEPTLHPYMPSSFSGSPDFNDAMKRELLLAFDTAMNWGQSSTAESSSNSIKTSALAEFFENLIQIAPTSCQTYFLTDMLKILRALSKGRIAANIRPSDTDLSAYLYLLQNAQEGVEEVLLDAFTQLAPTEPSECYVRCAMAKSQLVVAQEEFNELSKFSQIRSVGALELNQFIDRCEDRFSGVGLSEAAIKKVQVAVQVEERRAERLRTKTENAKREKDYLIQRIYYAEAEQMAEGNTHGQTELYNHYWNFFSKASSEMSILYSALHNALVLGNVYIISVCPDVRNISDWSIDCFNYSRDEVRIELDLNNAGPMKVIDTTMEEDVFDIIGLAHSCLYLTEVKDGTPDWNGCLTALKAVLYGSKCVIDGTCAQALCHLPSKLHSGLISAEGVTSSINFSQLSFNMAAIAALHIRHNQNINRVALIECAAHPSHGSQDILLRTQNSDFLLVSVHFREKTSPMWAPNALIEPYLVGYTLENNEDDKQMDSITQQLKSRLEQYRPGFIVISVMKGQEHPTDMQALRLIEAASCIARKHCGGRVFVLVTSEQSQRSTENIVLWEKICAKMMYREEDRE